MGLQLRMRIVVRYVNTWGTRTPLWPAKVRVPVRVPHVPAHVPRFSAVYGDYFYSKREKTGIRGRFCVSNALFALLTRPRLISDLTRHIGMRRRISGCDAALVTRIFALLTHAATDMQWKKRRSSTLLRMFAKNFTSMDASRGGGSIDVKIVRLRQGNP